MPGKSDVGWIWKLTKKEISDELEKRGVQVDPNATRDEIRDTLVLLVHEEAIAKREAAVATEDKDKPAVELQGESIETQAEQKVNASSTQCLRDTFQEYDSDSDNDMAKNSTRIKFCLNKDKWETFVERLEFQFLARDTTIDAKKAAILLTSIDEDAYELIKNLCAPQKLSEKKYAELTKVMTDHLEPKPSELMERNNFYKASQEQGESIADFAAQNLTFDTALKSAIAREMAQRNAQSNVGIKHQQDVLAIGQYNNQRERSSHNNKQGPRAQPSRHLGREAKDNSCWNCGGRGHTRYQCPSPVTSKQRNDCSSCGKPGHRRDVCKYKDATCGHCRKRGHIEDACFTKRANAKRGIQKIDKEGSEQDSDADEDAARSFEDHHEDFYTLDIVENKFVNKHFVSGDRDGAPMYVDVLINDLNTRMEVDSGTYESVISNKIWREKFSNARLSDTPVELRGYDGTIMNPIEKRSENLKPLYDLANQKDYVWNDECTKSFAWVKNELISPRVLAHYDPKEQIVLASDASDYGLSAILSHRYKDNTEKPIAYASRIIPKKEQKRTILDKEAMAVVFGFKRFRDFIFGKEIILRTDNKSLQLILGPRKGIPQTADNRFQRWAYYLSGFRYKIEHISSKANANCDALSRLPVKTEADIHLLKVTFSNVHYFDEGIDIVDSKKLARESIKDEVINKVIVYTKSDWPKLCDLTDVLKPYHRKKLELTVEKNCLFWGLRAIIPTSMRPTILRELHASHMGIVKIKMFARSYVWWPEIDHDIEFTVKNCSTCIIEAKKPPNSPLTTWPWPDRAWSRLHADFLGPFYGDMYLVVICAHSKWPEIINFKKNTKAHKLIEEFKTLFARFGLPVHLVTDGGPQFRSSEFEKFLKQNSVKHTLTPPYHPATNGAAENFVGIFKDKVSKIVKGGETVESAINKFLFDYRSIEHCTTGKSPYQMMYKRDMRTRFDVFRNHTTETVQAHQRAQIVSRSGSRRLELEKDDEVFIDDYRVNAEKRSKARIIKKLSPSTFAAKDEDNIIHKRHKDQIIKVPGSNEKLRRSPRFQNSNN
ncbi:unnamed protein product [Trichogramma brassicae]|uniref:RNA-directed DNA polymerase n=1 Tax=Trichogramma brassicae TaxID=86971 RepID=A0A6H5IW12_9HYME|nr:unnamed protein product [Trichogramma brassicae]